MEDPTPRASRSVRIRQDYASKRRDYDRLSFESTATITELDEFGSPGASWRVRLSDLSRSGLGLRSRRMVHLGRRVLLELRTTEARGTKVLFGTVRQSRYSEGEGYVVGIAFKALPRTTVIRDWLASRGLAA
jgi:hypothetical protein